MFTLPSIWNVLISTLIFVVVVRYVRKLLEEQGIPKSIARGLVIFTLAYFVSWASGVAVDYLQEKIEGQQVAPKVDMHLPVNF